MGMPHASRFPMSATICGVCAPPNTRVAKQLPATKYVRNIHMAQSVYQSVQLASPQKRASHITQFKHATAAELTKRQSDLATRKRYLTNFWYAASFTKKISHRTADATFLLDTNVLIWRDDHSGEVVCITATDPVTLQDISDKDAELTVYTSSEGTEETAMCAPAYPHSALHLSQLEMQYTECTKVC